MQKPIIIAHRGASAYAGGNTLESFRKALEFGADMIEFDVRRTKDHIFIAFHDKLIDNEPVSDLTHKDIQNRLRSKRIHLSTVEEILDFAKGTIKMDVDIKEQGYENELIELIVKQFGEDEFVVTSYNDSSLETIKHNYPWIKAGLILGQQKPENYIGTRFSELFPMKRCNMARADFLVPHFRLLKFGFLNRARRNNKPVYVWTVNDGKMISGLLNDHRVNAIITDRPDVAVALRNRVDYDSSSAASC
jgi:glycerophosphoryl diester phosphodiesterase